MKKPKILVCLTDFPFPARKNGYSIRYFPILQHFSQLYDMDLFVSVGEIAVPEEDKAQAEQFFSRITYYKKKKVHKGPLYKGIRRLISLIPYTTPFDMINYDLEALEKLFQEHCAGQHYVLTVCVSLTLFTVAKKYLPGCRITLDAIDSVTSLKMRSAANIIERYDAWLIKLWERRLTHQADAVSYISPFDLASGYGSLLPSSKASVIPNGVYIDDLTQDRKHYDKPTIGYLGHMGYPPNIRAAKRLFKILKLAQKSIPELMLVIIGRDPSADILELGSDSSVLVTGSVDNIWPYVNAIDLMVFPMETGSGQQNKLLESMAVGKPVISSALGNSGVGATHGTNILLADTDEEFAQAICRLLQNREQRELLGSQAEQFVHQKYSWPSIFVQLEKSIFSLGTSQD